MALCGVVRANSVNVPTSEGIYEYLERLEAYNCAYSTLRVFGPQTQYEMISAVYVSAEEDRCEAPEWLLRERQILTRPQYPVKIENRSVVVPDEFIALSGTGATISPLFPLREGRGTVGGFTSNTEMQAHASTSAKMIGIAGSVRPGWVGMIPFERGALGRFYLQEGYLKASYGWSEVTWGRTGLRFGQTKHGSLIFSGAAAPIDLLKYSLRPVVPGFAKFLGPVTFDTWVGFADPNTPSKGASLWALQFALRPIHWLELGWAELFQFGGAGVPKPSVGDLFAMVAYTNGSRLQTLRSRAMATHIGFWLPRRTAKVYAQTLFSDLHSIDDFSYLLGLWFPRIGSAQLRFEFVQTGTTPYQQRLFPGGLSYENTPLGHPLGPSARGFYADLEFLIFQNWRLELGGSYENRGRELFAGHPTLAPESRFGASVTLKKRWWELDVEGTLQYQNSTNAAYEAGVILDSIGGTTKITYSFL